MGAAVTPAPSSPLVALAAPAGVRRPLPAGAPETLALAMVAGAGLAAYAAERLVGPTNLALVFVLPVMIAAAAFGLRPALLAALAAVVVFDIFFLEPRYSLRVDAPADLWALVLLLSVALTVSGLAARLRRQASRAAADALKAGALQQMAHLVLHGGSEPELSALAADSLARVFGAPAAVVELAGAQCRPVSGAAPWSDADGEAARWVIEQGVATRAGAYPHDAARYDLWPVGGAARRALAIDFSALPGGRPESPERFVEAVAAYLALLPRP